MKGRLGDIGQLYARHFFNRSVERLIMYHVVLAVDDDRAQARELGDAVERLSEEAELKITLVHVFRNLDVPPQVSIHQLYGHDEMMEEMKDVPVSVRETVERLEALDCDVALEIETGNPGEQIVQLTEELDADTIYIGGRKTSPVGKVLFGSVAQDVIFNTDVPVTVSGSAE